MKKTNLYEMSFNDLCVYLKSIEFPQFHAQQIFSWLYQKHVSDINSMTNLPKVLREKLALSYCIGSSKVVKTINADDDSVKFLIGLSDGNIIETVLIRKGKRRTVCLSSQVGCKFGCLFCASGIGGWRRNLSRGEMLEQVMLAQRCSPEPVTHIVFMGTGEPLDNWSEVSRAIEIMNSAQAINIAARRITVSTCGVVPGIKKLASFNKQVELAVSLHGYNDNVRTQLMPVNKMHPLAELIAVCKEYIRQTHRQVTFEYVLIDELTCSSQAPQALAKILRGMTCKINLIPYNPVDEFDWKTPSRASCYRFRDALMAKGVCATIRWSKAKGSTGACGQLRWRQGISKQ